MQNCKQPGISLMPVVVKTIALATLTVLIRSGIQFAYT